MMSTVLARRFVVLRLSASRVPVYRGALGLGSLRAISTSLPRATNVSAAPQYGSPLTEHVPHMTRDVPQKSSPPEPEKGMPFAELKSKISAKTLKAITVTPMKHTHMTPVQESVLSMLPDLCEPYDPAAEDVPPRDLMVKARTGTGKTLAFLIPAIESRLKSLQKVMVDAKESGLAPNPREEQRAAQNYSRAKVGTLILSPTRELATQIANEAMKLTEHHEFGVHLFTGGVSKSSQLREWRRGRKDIVVATTGRLRDLLDSEPSLAEALNETKILILDEADTMLDMGFREDITAIDEFLPKAPERQTFVFSATINRAIEQVMRKVLDKNHVYINAVPEDASPVHAHVPQYHTVVPSAADQLPHVLRILAHDQLTNPTASKAIIFLPTTKLTQLYGTLLNELATSVLPAGRQTRIYEIHSKKAMESRMKTSERFRKENEGATVLVTSDVSARGVDYPGVTRVIQVGVPQSTEQYIHRVGRTGRTGGVIGRGDLVLLPWEAGFVNWQLGDVPMKDVATKDLEKEVHELAEKHDSDPSAFFAPYQPDPKARNVPAPTPRRSSRYPISFRAPVKSRVSAVDEEIKQLQTMIEPEAVEESFLSMLGYYAPKAEDMGVQRSDMLEGLKDWAVQAMGLPQPPHVSQQLLSKVGMVDRRRGSPPPKFGMRRGSDTNKPAWSTRGSGFNSNRDRRGSFDSRERGSSFGSGSDSGFSRGAWGRGSRGGDDSFSSRSGGFGLRKERR